MGQTGIGSYNLIAHLMMVGWFPLCFVLFLVMRPTKAVATGMVAGLLLLPNIEYEFFRIPDYDKSMAVGLGLILAALAFDRARLLSFRPRWVDLPVVIICVAPLLSNLANGYPLWSGLSGAFSAFVRWGMPWILGRIYFADFKPQHQLALAIVVGALLYAPFCLFEMKMSPLLHEIVYGVKLKTVKHAQRGMFWRPNVFLSHGLMCALYLAMAAFLAFTLWFTKARTALLRLPMLIVLAVLVAITVGASSKNAFLMMVVGMGCVVVARRLRTGLPVLLLIAIPVVYVGLRQGLGWDGQEIVEVSRSVFGEGRASSLELRFESEAMLSERAGEKVWLGYADMGEFTGNQPRDGTDRQDFNIIVDSMWLIFLGTNGVVGLLGAFSAMLLAPFLLWKRLPARYWTHPSVSMTTALAIMSALFALDCLLNSFENPVFIAAGGGVCGLLGTPEGKARWTT
jgi:hypothetical protein